MLIGQLLRDLHRPLFSFEFFPPKDPTAVSQLWAAIEHLLPLGPDFVSVTYGASGSSRERTIDVTRRIVTETKLRTMGHLTCVAQTRDELAKVVRDYAAAGVNRVFAVRGDMPGGPTVAWVAHPQGLANATELVRLVKEVAPHMEVGVAAFPDIHPASRDAALDARILVQKAEAGASFAITQMFFTAARYFELVERVRDLGCDIPIIPGVQPVTALSQIERFAQFSGADLPESLIRALRAAPTPADVRRVGSARAAKLCAELLDGGAPGLHFFTLNRSVATREIYALLLERFRTLLGGAQ